VKIIDEIEALLATRGRSAYHGEAVSQAEHALQAARLADREGAPGALVDAALQHDVGHLVGVEDVAIAERGIDGRHEDSGASWLAAHFPAAVVEPIRLHVAAKRYLCAVDPAYRAALSPASALSLRLQGGPMGPAEVAAFEATPHHADAVRLRRWDDAAKVPGLDVPGVAHYRDRLAASLRR
jgi:gamma-butyrobetaine dioxygenase